MGRLVVHAGMPKAGSSAVQQLLFHHAAELAELGVVTAVARWEAGALQLEPATERSNNSVDVVLGLRDQTRREATLAGFRRGVERFLTDRDCVVVTSEALAQPFWQGDEDFLGLLDDLAATHDVHVAYYVRPQHSALEASWRQWGYRSGMRAGQYMIDRSRMMDYHATVQLVRELAPAVDFLVRPFRRDLLTDGDVGSDFLARVLGTTEVPYVPTDANRGFPLDLVNLLALAPSSPLWEHEHENRRLAVLKQVIRDAEVTPSPDLVASRQLLQQLCHDRYEEQNQQLADLMGWSVQAFVPAAGIEVGDRSLADFDALWRPAVDPSAVAWLHESLDLLVGQRLEHLRARRRAESAEQEAAAASEGLQRVLDRRVVRLGLRVAKFAEPVFRRMG